MNLAFIFNSKRDRLEFHVNVKEFWILFVMREKAKELSLRHNIVLHIRYWEDKERVLCPY